MLGLCCQCQAGFRALAFLCVSHWESNISIWRFGRNFNRFFIVGWGLVRLFTRWGVGGGAWPPLPVVRSGERMGIDTGQTCALDSYVLGCEELVRLEAGDAEWSVLFLVLLRLFVIVVTVISDDISFPSFCDCDSCVTFCD